MAVLFLQGPMGPFFKHMACQLKQAGFEVRKINFNGGDDFYYKNSITTTADNYRDTPENWRLFLKDYVKLNNIDTIFVYGDCRFYHRVAKEVANQSNIEFVVCEEGYLRPHFITMEFGGANAYSQLDLSPHTIKNTIIPEQPRPQKTGYKLRNWGKYAAIYYWASWFAKHQFSEYQHHRDSSPLREGFCWLRSGVRKLLAERPDLQLQNKLTKKLKNRFFLVPLQVHNDSQLLYHSDYESIEDFIRQTIISFKINSNEEHHLVFKHHPMDRGHKNYTNLIASISNHLGISCRVHYGFELHLPTLIDNSLGCVTINSTVGISAIMHSCPTKCCGRAHYDIPGLTSQCPLDQFWKKPEAVNEDFFKRFNDYLQNFSQINGNFYKNPEYTAEKCCGFFIEKRTTLKEIKKAA